MLHVFSMLLNIIERYVVLGEPVVRRAVLVVKMAVGTRKSYKSPFIFKIPVRFLQSECKTVFSKFHKLIYSVWNKVKFLTSRITLLFYTLMKSVKIYCSNYRGKSLLPTT